MMRHPLFWLILVVCFAAGGSGFNGFNWAPIAMAEKAVR